MPTCKFCSASIPSQPGRSGPPRSVCSDCRTSTKNAKARLNYAASRSKEPRNCLRCAKPIPSTLRTDAYYCSGKCRQQAAGSRRDSNICRHGITPEQFAALLLAQGGTCAIPACEAAQCSNGRRLHIDHDHRCCPGHDSCGSCIRGLLCDRHNVAIGMCQDDPEQLRDLARYLEAPRFHGTFAVAS